MIPHIPSAKPRLLESIQQMVWILQQKLQGEGERERERGRRKEREGERGREREREKKEN